MHLVVFESDLWQRFLPFAFSRPTFALVCGFGTLLEKQIRAVRPDRLTLWVRPEMRAWCQRHLMANLSVPTTINTPLDSEPAFLLDGRTLYLTADDRQQMSGSVAVDERNGDQIRQAIVTEPGLSFEDALTNSPRWKLLLNLPHTAAHSRLAQYAWDLLAWNEEALVADFARLDRASQPFPTGPYHVLNDDNIFFGDNVTLSPGCVLDASQGPIMLSDACGVGANAVIQGPCRIGPHSQIAPLAMIRPGTSIGLMCKLGGEISNSIILNYTNKAHEGFLGNSYLGEWVNFGAGTTTSNLKNTYGAVSIKLAGQSIETHRQILGSLIGDHTKTAIGTRLMTGSCIGYCSMIAISGHVPNSVGSFRFLTDAGDQPYNLEKAAAVMKAVFNRRHLLWTDDDQRLNEYVANLSGQIDA